MFSLFRCTTNVRCGPPTSVPKTYVQHIFSGFNNLQLIVSYCLLPGKLVGSLVAVNWKGKVTGKGKVILVTGHGGP
jgi:hypothetical protein